MSGIRNTAGKRPSAMQMYLHFSQEVSESNITKIIKGEPP
jgi:hypothetical protein